MESIYGKDGSCQLFSFMFTAFADAYDSKTKPDIQNLQAALEVFMIETQLIDRRLHLTLFHFNDA
jgi:hypothetical protein